MEFSRPEYWSGSLSLLQGIFPTQGSNPGLLNCRWILYQLSYQGSPDVSASGFKIKHLGDFPGGPMQRLCAPKARVCAC